MRDDALTARIAAIKQRLLVGGLLMEVEWQRRTGVKDVRGRQAVDTTLLDVLIEQRPALDRGPGSTDRADDTVVVVLDPVAITDEHLFRWGDPLHTYSIKGLSGLIQDELIGLRYYTEAGVIR
jgi:hypothetical protein